jgi:hypothetical protein
MNNSRNPESDRRPDYTPIYRKGIDTPDVGQVTRLRKLDPRAGPRAMRLHDGKRLRVLAPHRAGPLLAEGESFAK